MTVDRWAWDEYWREQGALGAGCMANAPGAFHRAIGLYWQAAASRLASGATVVDLGCGTGSAGRQLLAARPDIALIGIDFADMTDAVVPAGAGSAIDIRGRTSIEALPFPPGSFDGAVSQFGFEYCEVGLGVHEVARVLRRGAPLSLIVHHAQSPIVLDNVRNDRALRQLLAGPMKRAFLGGDQTTVRAIVATLPAPVRVDPAIQLLSSALVERSSWADDGRARSWDAIAHAMRPEIALSAALNRSAVEPAHLHRWLVPFHGRFDHVVAKPFEVGGQTMAWTIEARRAG